MLTRNTQKNRRTEPMTRSVCTCVIRLSLNNASVSRKYVKSILTQTCSACELCNLVEKTNKSIAQPSRCNSQYMSWTWFQISEARPSYSSEARRTPNICSSGGNTLQDQQTNIKESGCHHRERELLAGPQHKVSMCPRIFRARNVRSPDLCGPREESNSPEHTGATR